MWPVVMYCCEREGLGTELFVAIVVNFSIWGEGEAGRQLEGEDPAAIFCALFFYPVFN